MNLKSISLPDLGEGVTEGEILKIQVKEGQNIVMDQVLLEVMTDKASMEIPSFMEGRIKSIEVKEGDIVSVGSPLFMIETEESNASFSETKSPEKSDSNKTKAPESLVPDKKSLKEPEKKPESFKGGKDPLAIPATRKLAHELGLDLKEIAKGKSPVTREDLLSHVKTQLNSPSSPSLPELAEFEEEKRLPLKGIKRLMFESMTLSKASIPHFTIGEQAKVQYLVQLRTEMKNRLDKQGIKVGYLPFFIKALIPVIKDFSIFNAVYDHSTKEIVFKKELNIGFAVDSPQGLLVPVIKSVQQKSLLEIIREVFKLSQSARDGSIKREDLKGASLTFTNLGSLGGMYGTPIIQAPEMAILGIYKIFPKVIKNEEGAFEEVPFMNFSLTCDHRFIDGATAARFLKSFIQNVEEPSLLLL